MATHSSTLPWKIPRTMEPGMQPSDYNCRPAVRRWGLVSTSVITPNELGEIIWKQSGVLGKHCPTSWP